jgi:hypothetical protein
MKQSPRIVLIEIAFGLLVLVLGAAGLFAWRLSQGPLDLEWVRPQIERSLSQARGGQPVKLEAIVLEWSRKTRRIEAAARGLTAYDASGQAMFAAERAVLALDAPSLLIGRFKIEGLALQIGSATVNRSREGVWTLAGVELLREPGPRDRPFNPLRDLNWMTLATPLRAIISAGSFERVEIQNFRIDVVDERLGSTWTANPASGAWRADRQGVSLEMAMTLSGGAGANSVRLALSSDGKVSEANGQLDLQGVDPLTIARMFGYRGDQLTTDRPASASFRISASEAGGLTSAGLSLSEVSGRLKAGAFETGLADASLEAAYDPATQRVELTRLDIDADRLRARLSGSGDLAKLMAGDAASPIPVTLKGSGVELDLSPMFEAPWRFEALEASGALATNLQSIEVASLAVTAGAFNARGAGSFWLDQAGEGPRLGVKITASGAGALTTEQLAAFWPVKLGAGARRWVVGNIPEGRVTKAAFAMDWPPGANAQGYIADEVLTLDFEAEGVTVRFLQDFPAVTGVAGTGQLRGNSLNMKVSGGALGAWRADEGEILIPKFYPKDDFITVVAAGQGSLRDMMKVLDASFLKVGSRYGLPIDEMEGHGGLELVLKRPVASTAPDGDVTYEIKGGFRRVRAPRLVGEFGLSETDTSYRVTGTGLAITGVGKFGSAPVEFSWSEPFGDPGQKSQLTAKGMVTPDFLNAFGIVARNLMQGEARMELTAVGPADRFESITANLDLTQAGLDIPEFGWTKKIGAAAKGVFRYGSDADGATAALDIRSDGLELVGDARLDAKGGVERADLERVYSRDRLDLRGAVTRRADGGYRLVLSGPLFDARPWMDSILSMPQSSTGGASGGAAGGPEPAASGASAGPAIEMQLNVGQLRLRDEEDLRKTEIALEFDAAGPRSGRVRGEISPGKALDLEIRPESGGRRIRLKADDAGFGARVVLKTDYLTGGSLALDGLFDAAGGAAQVSMENVRLKDAPLLAQMLSLASLRGLTDVLSGEGVLFTRVEAPVRFEKGRILLPGLKASGPAMGLTARGWISPQQGELSLDGVLVPSFGVNSALGGIPIIGDLFVSRQGEGIFAPTYSVRGTFSRARVSINPIAAVTPGVLRRIFEVPEEAPPAEGTVPAVPAQ